MGTGEASWRGDGESRPPALHARAGHFGDHIACLAGYNKRALGMEVFGEHGIGSGRRAVPSMCGYVRARAFIGGSPIKGVEVAAGSPGRIDYHQCPASRAQTSSWREMALPLKRHAACAASKYRARMACSRPNSGPWPCATGDAAGNRAIGK